MASSSLVAIASMAYVAPDAAEAEPAPARRRRDHTMQPRGAKNAKPSQLISARVGTTASRTLQGTPTVVPPIISATRRPPPGMTWSQASAQAVPLATDDT